MRGKGPRYGCTGRTRGRRVAPAIAKKESTSSQTKEPLMGGKRAERLFAGEFNKNNR